MWAYEERTLAVTWGHDVLELLFPFAFDAVVSAMGLLPRCDNGKKHIRMTLIRQRAYVQLVKGSAMMTVSTPLMNPGSGRAQSRVDRIARAPPSFNYLSSYLCYQREKPRFGNRKRR
jgi:hypothetical protein